MSSKDVVTVLFGTRLRQLLAEKSISQTNFADMIGITKSRMNNYIIQRSEPDYATLIRIANALDTTTDYLLGKTEHQGLPQTVSPAGIPEFIPRQGEWNKPSDNKEWIDIYISCPEVVESATDCQPVGWIRHPCHKHPHNFREPYALIIKDDTMKPYLMPHDIAFIQPMVIFHNCLPNSNNVDIYSVRLSSEDTIGLSLKKCYSRGNMLVFYCENSFYNPYIINITQIKFYPIIGKVMSIWRPCMGNSILTLLENSKLEDSNILNSCKE